jgi:hypothetical protein
MIRRIIQERESGVVSHLRNAHVTACFTDLCAQPNNAPISNSPPAYRELVVGELVTSLGSRRLSIAIHPHCPIMSYFVIVSITNVHPNRSFSRYPRSD